MPASSRSKSSTARATEPEAVPPGVLERWRPWQRPKRPQPPPYQQGAHWIITAPAIVILLGLGLLWLQGLEFKALRELRGGVEQPEIALLDYAGQPFARLGGGRGRYLSLDQMSPWLPAAVIAIEDRRFYRHLGIDPIGLARAMWQNLLAGGIVQGGSTITQQLIKLSYLGPERSLIRKLKEAALAVAIELRFSKDEILEAYLNKVYLGAGAHGIDAAAKRYFAKSAAELTLAESAMLAGLIKAPSRFAPTRKLARAQIRAEVVLTSMVNTGAASAAEAALAREHPAGLAAAAGEGELGYFRDWIGAESRLYAAPGQARLLVQTTLDRELQSLAEETVRDIFARYGGEFGVEQAALVAMTPDGLVRAMLGGRDYRQSQFNRATQAERQPGSAFKLFLYLAALEAGRQPDDRIAASAIRIGRWQPRNADDRYPERVPMSEAFTHSINTAAVRLAEEVGYDQVVRMARRLGLSSTLHNHPSLALGSAEVNLLELTAAYATIANGGWFVWPEGLSSVATADGDELYLRPAIAEQVLDEATVDAMMGMLRATLTRGTGWRAQLAGGNVAGKTGTSSNHRDAWFVGFTPALVVGIWVGNDDGRPMAMVSGGGMPAMIFRDFVERASAHLTVVADRPAPPEEAPVASSGMDWTETLWKMLGE
jgi:penicillin-binding protein 1A